MKSKISGSVSVNAYAVLSDAIERALVYGYKRAHKHTGNPGEDVILEQQHQAIMNEISEYFNFNNED